MKNKKLMESFSLIDDDLVKEADPTAALLLAKEKKTRGVFRRVAPLVAAACLLVAIVLPTVYFGLFSGGAPTTTASVVTTVSLGAPNYNSPVITNNDMEFGGFEDAMPSAPDMALPEGGTSNDSYTEFVENGFVNTVENNKSFFSIDVSTASFPNIRSTLKAGVLPHKDAYRVEEILNYFKFDYQTPENGEIFALNASMFPNPYNRETMLLTVGLAAEAVEFRDTANNLVFLIDVSGSMYADNKLPLAQKAFKMLTENLNPGDRVSIVTYAGNDCVALSGAYGYEKDKIMAVIDDLKAGGSTAGADGIQTAYQIAQQYFIEDGNNRVILMTDGDFNVGVSSNEGLVELISQKRTSGVYFSVYGFGMGNWQADKMEAMALAGNGMYGYIDSELEAKRALVDEIGGSLVTVAKDVKAGIIFNEDYVDSYRLVGYETKQMSEDEFNNTEKDAGEIGSGHTVTVVYEIKLSDRKSISEIGTLGSVEIRYKSPDSGEDRSAKLDVTTDVYHEVMTANDAFVASVVEFVLLARDSVYKADASLNALISRLDTLDLSADEYKSEFRDIVKLYQEMAKK